MADLESPAFSIPLPGIKKKKKKKRKKLGRVLCTRPGLYPEGNQELWSCFKRQEG
jgi:hypothetical protein